ncbi:MAG: hypothetical protein GXY03_13845 [Solirubrobacterales bacterium]|nr:hypothetical protein [Solirubrobacterales bacterium]
MTASVKIPPPPAAPRPVCVLGVGRSGTSLAARALNRLGVDLGDEDTMLPPGEANPKGFWEQRDVVALNDQILAALGGEWWRPPPRPPGWERWDVVAPFRERIAELVERHFGGSPRWGFKDPRTTLTLPLWRSVVGEFDYVICLRNPLEVIASAGGALPGTVDEPRLWLQYSCEALRVTAGCRREFVFYEEWLGDAEAVGRRLARFLDPGRRDDAWSSAAETWDPLLRRQQSDDVELAQRADLPIEVRVFHFVARTLADAERLGAPRASALQALAVDLDGGFA